MFKLKIKGVVSLVCVYYVVEQVIDRTVLIIFYKQAYSHNRMRHNGVCKGVRSRMVWR